MRKFSFYLAALSVLFIFMTSTIRAGSLEDSSQLVGESPKVTQNLNQGVEQSVISPSEITAETYFVNCDDLAMNSFGNWLNNFGSWKIAMAHAHADFDDCIGLVGDSSSGGWTVVKQNIVKKYG